MAPTDREQRDFGIFKLFTKSAVMKLAVEQVSKRARHSTTLPAPPLTATLALAKRSCVGYMCVAKP